MLQRVAILLFLGNFPRLEHRLLGSKFHPLLATGLDYGLPLGTLAGLGTSFLDSVLLTSRRTFHVLA